MSCWHKKKMRAYFTHDVPINIDVQMKTDLSYLRYCRSGEAGEEEEVEDDAEVVLELEVEVEVDIGSSSQAK